VNAAGDGERLPSTIGGLVDLALESVVTRFWLYLALALVMIGATAAIEYLMPARDMTAFEWRTEFVEWATVLISAYAIAVVALDVGSRVAGERAETGALARGAALRFGRVAVAAILLQFVLDNTEVAGALTGPLDPFALALAPFVWFLWGVLGLAPPMAALSGERGAFAALSSFVRAAGFSLQAANLPRLALLALLAVAPSLLAIVLIDALGPKVPTISHAYFWCNAPIEALTLAPLTAVQTAFALDFARRAGRLSR